MNAMNIGPEITSLIDEIRNGKIHGANQLASRGLVGAARTGYLFKPARYSFSQVKAASAASRLFCARSP